MGAEFGVHCCWLGIRGVKRAVGRHGGNQPSFGNESKALLTSSRAGQGTTAAPLLPHGAGLASAPGCWDPAEAPGKP